jgi:hypothetical protein
MESENAGEELVRGDDFAEPHMATQNEDVGVIAAQQAEAEAASPEIADEPTKADTIEQEIENWFREHFYNSIVSADTAIINHVRAGVDLLKVRIKNLL